MQEKIKKLIPSVLRSKITNRPILQKIVKNIGWLTGERILELIVALTVGIWVARYLGPSDFGLMSFAIAFTSLFSPFINLGLDTILNRELVEKPEKTNLLLGTVFRIKLISSIFIGFLLLLIIYLIKPTDFLLFLMVGIFAFGKVIKSFDDLSKYFASKIESEKKVKSNSIALILSNCLKVFFILFNFSVIWFVFSAFVNTVLRNLLQIFYYLKGGKSILKWKFKCDLAKELLSKSWPLMFSAIFAVLYLRIDQLMIGFMLGDYELGIYSVAVKLSEIGFFLPGVIAGSLFPAILASRKKSKKLYLARLQRMFDIFTWIPFFIIIPIFFLSNFIIVFLYGVEFTPAGVVLSILIWALLAIFIRAGVDNYIVFEELYKIKIYYSLMGAVINIIANLILIPIYGIVGAAIATIISYFFVAYISNLFFKKTRKVFLMQLKSFNLIRVLNSFMK